MNLVYMIYNQMRVGPERMVKIQVQIGLSITSKVSYVFTLLYELKIIRFFFCFMCDLLEIGF